MSNEEEGFEEHSTFCTLKLDLPLCFAEESNDCHLWKCVTAPPKVVIHVHHIDEERFGGDVLLVKVLHLLVHHDCLPGDLLPWTLHPE